MASAEIRPTREAAAPSDARGESRGNAWPSQPRFATSATRRVAASLAALLLAVSAAPALAHDHDPEEVGHPLRVVAYTLHPVGVVLDYLIFRPAHWIVSFEPLSTLFGHDSEHD